MFTSETSVNNKRHWRTGEDRRWDLRVWLLVSLPIWRGIAYFAISGSWDGSSERNSGQFPDYASPGSRVESASQYPFIFSAPSPVPGTVNARSGA